MSAVATTSGGPVASTATDADEAVVTRNLTKVYKDFWGRDKVRALDDLNLTIHRGEVFGLLGPNGSGKSTTIKLLLGLIFPSRGSATILGQPVGSTVINEKIGFLPEESYLYRFLNGEETLWFYGRLFKIPRRELKKRVPALLDTVGLDAKARKRKLREYSKGMARRIGSAQALINNPELGLLHEPTTGFDPIGTREMKDLILSLKNQGKTVILCSHLLADVQDVCDRITILFRGKMQTLGQVKDLLQVKDVTQIETGTLTPQQIEETR
ncbi:MAG TPA: ABC transporter ATP-binding protein, partial [Tepidisphaeraceae bacterium]|nr:ABC transporter ATP-binding protein [Tepidisphaeraceae bacterium]